MSEYYITKAEILEWIQEQVPDMTNIPDRIMEKGHNMVRRNLVMIKVYDIPNTSDTLGFLKEAASCFILSLCCRARLISQTSGEVLSDKFGEVSYQYETSAVGKFYVRTGPIDFFRNLIPFETFRIMGTEFCKAYKRYYEFYKKRKLNIPKSAVVRDKTSRGSFWNEYVSDIEVADSEYGDIDPMEKRFLRATKPRWA